MECLSLLCWDRMIGNFRYNVVVHTVERWRIYPSHTHTHTYIYIYIYTYTYAYLPGINTFLVYFKENLWMFSKWKAPLDLSSIQTYIFFNHYHIVHHNIFSTTLYGVRAQRCHSGSNNSLLYHTNGRGYHYWQDWYSLMLEILMCRLPFQ